MVSVRRIVRAGGMGHSGLDNDVAIGVNGTGAGGVAGQPNSVACVGVSGEVSLVADLLPLLRTVLGGDDDPPVEGVLGACISGAGVLVADKVDGVDVGVGDLRELLYNLDLIEQHVVFGVAGYHLVDPLLVNVQAVLVLVNAAVALKLNLKAVGAGDEAGVLPVALHAHLIDIMVSQLGLVNLNAVPGSDDAGVGVGNLRELVNGLLSLVKRLPRGALGGGGVLGCLVSGGLCLVSLVRSSTDLILKLVEGGLDSLVNEAYGVRTGIGYLAVS